MIFSKYCWPFKKHVKVSKACSALNDNNFPSSFTLRVSLLIDEQVKTFHPHNLYIFKSHVTAPTTSKRWWSNECGLFMLLQIVKIDVETWLILTLTNWRKYWKIENIFRIYFLLLQKSECREGKLSEHFVSCQCVNGSINKNDKLNSKLTINSAQP